MGRAEDLRALAKKYGFGVASPDDPIYRSGSVISFRNNTGSPTTNSSTQEPSPSQDPGSAPQGPEEAEGEE